MSSSLRRILASRANGARSQGPATPQGKQRSSQNAVRHGLLARCIVMEKESLQSFEALLTQHLDSLQPVDGVEFGMVEEMVASYWRMRRAWAIETRMLEDAADTQAGSDPPGPLPRPPPHPPPPPPRTRPHAPLRTPPPPRLPALAPQPAAPPRPRRTKRT